MQRHREEEEKRKKVLLLAYQVIPQQGELVSSIPYSILMLSAEGAGGSSEAI